eukprot:5547280-Prymnesium_polylepis.1
MINQPPLAVIGWESETDKRRGVLVNVPADCPNLQRDTASVRFGQLIHSSTHPLSPGHGERDHHAPQGRQGGCMCMNIGLSAVSYRLDWSAVYEVLASSVDRGSGCFIHARRLIGVSGNG